MIQEKPYHHGNLEATCINSGIAILLEEGEEKLTLRNVARRSNVSHNAPYRAFKNKEALLIAIAQKIYVELTSQIFEIANDFNIEPHVAFKMMCSSFFNYAIENPIKYRFITSNIINNQGAYQSLTNIVTEAFIVVKTFLETHIKKGNFRKMKTEQMAIYCISIIHGYCSIVIENKLELLKTKNTNQHHQFNFIINQLLDNLKLDN